MRRTPLAPPSPDTPVSETVIGVRTSELDSFGHVNHAVYLTYFEHARFEALAEAGFDWGVLAERGWAIFVVRIEVDYVAEAKRQDQLLIRTWADSFRRTSMVLGQEMVRADDRDAVVARARVSAVWIGPDRRAMRVPDEVREGLSGPRSAASAASTARDDTPSDDTTSTHAAPAVAGPPRSDDSHGDLTRSPEDAETPQQEQSE